MSYMTTRPLVAELRYQVMKSTFSRFFIVILFIYLGTITFMQMSWLYDLIYIDVLMFFHPRCLQYYHLLYFRFMFFSPCFLFVRSYYYAYRTVNAVCNAHGNHIIIIRPTTAYCVLRCTIRLYDVTKYGEV